MTDWEQAQRQLADADDQDPRADGNRPPEVVDGGPWPVAMDTESWLSRFTLPVDVDLIRSSFRVAPHAGSVPRVCGPGLSRRRVERTRVA